MAFYEGTAVGFLTVSTLLVKLSLPGVKDSSGFDPQMVLLGKLYVADGYRSGGIGAKLLSFVVDLAVTMDELVGCQGIIVDSNRDSRTVDFYHQFGFEDLEEIDDEVRMFFRLPQEPTL